MSDLPLVAAFLLIAVVVTFPLAVHFSTALPGGGDSWLYYWDLWWVRRAMLEHHVTPYFTTEVYYPYGTSLYFHTLNVLPSLIASPLAWLGLAAAYNTLVFASFVLSGLAMYRLAWHVLAHDIDPTAVQERPSIAKLACFIAAVAFAFSSYRLAHVRAHLDLAWTPWLPYVVLSVLRLRDDAPRRRVFVAALLLAATTLTALYYTLFLMVFVALFVILVVVPARDWATFRRLALAGAAFAVMISPIAVPLIAAASTQGHVPNPTFDVDRFSADLVAFIAPSPMQPAIGRTMSAIHGVNQSFKSGIESVVFFGYVPLALAGVAAIRYRRLRSFWIPLVVVFTALALGPVPRVAGHPAPAWLQYLMPYRWLEAMPYGDMPRVPARFAVMATLALDVMAAVGAWRLLRDRSAGAARVAVVVLVVAALVETSSPLTIASIDTPPLFERLRQTPDSGALLELPIPDDPSTLPRRMLYQTVHEMPIFGGYVARSLPPLQFDALPGFSQLKTLSDTVDDVVVYDPEALPAVASAVLHAYGVKAVVIEKSEIPRSQLPRYREVTARVLQSDADAEDDHTIGYFLRPRRGPLPSGLWLDTGWSYLERLPGQRATEPDRWRWMGERARVGVMMPVEREVRIAFRASGFRTNRPVQFTLDGRIVARTTIVPTPGDYVIGPFQVPARVSFLEIQSVNGAESPGVDPRRLSVAFYRMELLSP